MKKVVVAALLIISQLGFSQDEISKNVGDFNQISSFDKISVFLVSANENKIILKGEGSSDVELINNNGELKIRMPLNKLLKGDNVIATVYYKNIDEVEASEGSKISSDEILKGTNFDINAKQGSEVKLNLEVDRVSIKASAGSKIYLNGKTKTQDVLINSGAILEAENFISNQTIITANAGGEATIFATDFVDAKIRAGGNIDIYGKPKQIKQKVIAGGTITEK